MSEGNLQYNNLKGFNELFDSLYARLCLFANGYVNDTDLSEDLVQEVFIKVWEKKPILFEHIHAKAYLYRAVRNRCLNYLKSKRRWLINKSVDPEQLDIESEDFFDTSMFTVETYSALYNALDMLPKKTAKVIELTLKDYSNNEIADELSVSTSTVRTQKSLAYQKLRKLLNGLNQFFTFFF